jgi:hypothetical protein
VTVEAPSGDSQEPPPELLEDLSALPNQKVTGEGAPPSSLKEGPSGPEGRGPGPEAPEGTGPSVSGDSLSDILIPPHDHELPLHEHEEISEGLKQQSREVNRLKMALAQLGRRVLEREQEIVRLRGSILQSERERHQLAQEISRLREERESLTQAIPVVVYDTDTHRVEGVSLFAAGPRGPLEALVSQLLGRWQGDEGGVEVSGVPPHMRIRLKGEGSERGLDLLPSSVLFLRLSHTEVEALGPLPPLVAPPPAEPSPERPRPPPPGSEGDPSASAGNGL